MPKRIEDVQEGDLVLSKVDGEQRIYGKVTDTFRAVHLQPHFLINGQLEVTAQHPFLMDDEWVVAEDLRVGDRLVGVDGETVEIEKIETFDFATRVYNIEVEGEHTFYANRVLVHN